MNLRSVLHGGYGRRLRVRRGAAMLVAVSVAMLGGIAVAASTASATPNNPGKVWICHATDSDTNPYKIIHPDVNSAKWKGHLSHATEPNKRWKSGGTFGGVSHLADQKKPDIFGSVNAESAPARCFGTTQNASLTLVNVVSGGTAAASVWTLSAAGPTSFSGVTPASSAVLPGTYTLSESTGPANYVASGWACTGVANSGATVILAAGQSATCTITNTFVPPGRTVVTPPPGVVLGEVVTFAPANVVEGAVVTNAPVVAGAQVTRLAFTGAETVPLGLSGLLALLLGAGLVATARRQGRRANN
jgi:hypothetical protein